MGGKPIAEYTVRSSTEPNEQDSFFEKQRRIVLSRCGHIDPESIDEALAMDAYKGLEKALKTMTPSRS